MRKKDLQARNDQLLRELGDAAQLAADQMRQINDGRMQLALLKVELGMPSNDTGQHVAKHASSTVILPEPVALGMKMCPDCAEEVRVAARRCRFCNYRFDPAERPWAESGSMDPAPADA